MAVRAVAVNPEAAGLVGIDVLQVSAFAFALGGAVTAVGGALISSFLIMDASVGVVFTMKALREEPGADAQAETAARDEALVWLEAASQAGYASAQINLAAIYLGGEPEPLDRDRGIHWLRRAAAQGNAEARTALAKLEGVRASVVPAQAMP